MRIQSESESDRARTSLSEMRPNENALPLIFSDAMISDQFESTYIYKTSIRIACMHGIPNILSALSHLHECMQNILECVVCACVCRISSPSP